MMDRIKSVWPDTVKGVGAGLGWRLNMMQPVRVEPHPEWKTPVLVFGPQPGYGSIGEALSTEAALGRIGAVLSGHLGYAIRVRYDADWHGVKEGPTEVNGVERAPVVVEPPRRASLAAILEKSTTAIVAATSKPSRYREYLASDEWKLRREAMLWLAGYRCQVCNAHKRDTTLDVHHRTYERIGREAPHDLFVLCRACHRLFSENGRLAKD